MRRFLRDNGLSIAWLGLFFVAFSLGQTVTGYRVHNDEVREHGGAPVGYVEYLRSPHLVEATLENWESEFFQMFLYVVLTAFLFQRGSAESKDPDRKEEVDRPPQPGRKDAPWPVRRGGLALRLYQNSLGLAFLLLFLASFVGHAAGGAGEYNQEQALHGSGETVGLLGYMGTSRFWFESLQNWQSEFLAVAAMVLLSIFLRQRGSPESKPVDAPHSATGKG